MNRNISSGLIELYVKWTGKQKGGNGYKLKTINVSQWIRERDRQTDKQRNNGRKIGWLVVGFMAYQPL